MKVIILYGTRLGATRECAELIRKGLAEDRRHDITVVNVKALHSMQKVIKDYDAVVLGSSVFAGQWVRKARNAMKMAVGKPCAVYINTPSSNQAREKAVHSYIDPLLEKYHLNPVSVNVFGGKFSLFGKEVYNNWSSDYPYQWGRTLSKALSA